MDFCRSDPAAPAVSSARLAIPKSVQKNMHPISGYCCRLFAISWELCDSVEKQEESMIGYSQGSELDELDLAILRTLQDDGRISNADLAQRINLSPPATHARVRRLTERGYIRGYVALLDKAKLGYDMTCFISVSLQMHQVEGLEAFRASVRQFPEVLECHHVTGEFDFLLKAVVRNRQDLERFVVNRLTPIPGVARINTSLALSETKSTTALPLPANSPHGD